MKTNVLRSVAATLSLGFCSVASAQYGAPVGYGGGYQNVPQTQAVRTFQGAPATMGQPVAPGYAAGVYQQPNYQHPGFQQPNYQSPAYQAPSNWNTFGVANRGPSLFQPVSSGLDDSLLDAEQIPTPAPAGGSFGSGQKSMTSPSVHAAPSPTPAPQYSAPQYSAPQYSAPQYSTSPTVMPQASAYPAPAQHFGTPAPHIHNNAGPDGSCSSCSGDMSPYMAAASQPWEGVGYANAPACGVPMAAPMRAPLFPWFGTFDVLFYNLDSSGKDRNLVSAYSAVDPTRPYLPTAGIASLDPDSAVGYNLGFGRYFGCGKYGLGVNYLNWNPDVETFQMTGTALDGTGNGDGAFRAAMPHYHGAAMPTFLYDNGTQPGDSGDDYQDITGAGSPYSVYDIIDGTAGQTAADNGDLDADYNGTGANTYSYAEAVAVRARRDVDIQGLEVNLFCFGLMGAQRASALSCGGGGCGTGFGSFLGLGGYGGVGGYGGGNCNNGCEPCGPRFGFGGAGGPLVRPCSGKLQVINSHGLRWFQFNDSLDFAYDVDGRAGYTANDIYDTTSTENDLFGYQFGSRLVYCLGSRVNLNLGGKFGLYGNQATFRHRLGTMNETAELAAMPGLDIDYTTEDTVVSTLGELDLGLGYRVNNAWTLRGGYRVMGVTGIATAVDNQPRDYSSSASASALHADSSLLLHGAYLGADFNW